MKVSKLRKRKQLPYGIFEEDDAIFVNYDEYLE